MSPSLRWLTTRWLGERVDVLEPDRRVVRQQRLPLLVAAWRRPARAATLEVLGAVVVQHEEDVLAADHGVLDAVLDALAAGRDDAELAGRVGRRRGCGTRW